MGERRGVYKVLVGEFEGRPWCRWEDNIEMDLQEADVGAWTGLMWLSIETGGGLL
jgi:hypothetical protein